MRNRCTEAFGLCRSRLTVDAKVKCSSTAQLRFPDAPRDPLTPHQSFPSSALTPCSTPPSTWTSAHDHPRKHLHQHFLTSLTLHPLTFLLSHCPPLVPSKSNTRQQCAKAPAGRPAYHRQLTVAAAARPVRSSVGALGVLAAERSWWLLAQTTCARRSGRPVSSGRASWPWSTRPAATPRRRSPVSSRRCPPIRSRASGIWLSSRPLSGHLGSSSSGSGARPSAVHPSAVQPSGVQPAIRTRSSPPMLRRWQWDQGRAGRATLTTGTCGGPGGCRAVDGLDRRSRRPGRERRCPRSRWSGGGRWPTGPPGWGCGLRRPRLPAE
jgi:hypothetical protein